MIIVIRNDASIFLYSPEDTTRLTIDQVVTVNVVILKRSTSPTKGPVPALRSHLSSSSSHLKSGTMSLYEPPPSDSNCWHWCICPMCRTQRWQMQPASKLPKSKFLVTISDDAQHPFQIITWLTMLWEKCSSWSNRVNSTKYDFQQFNHYGCNKKGPSGHFYLNSRQSEKVSTRSVES